MCQGNTTIAIPRLVRTRKAIFDIPSITSLMGRCVAHITENNFIPFIIIITKTNIADDTIILIVLFIVNECNRVVWIKLLLFANLPR